MRTREDWQQRHAARPERGAPSAFVAEHVARRAAASPGGRALDLACGSGRHTALLAASGFRAVALDQSGAACARVAHEVRGAHPVVADALALPFADATFDVVVQTLFLERALFPRLLGVLAPGGVLLAETFLVAQHEATGHPRREYCLDPGELVRLCMTVPGVRVAVVDAREGPVKCPDGVRHLAAVAICKQ